MKKLQRTYYYQDPLNDDFALNDVKAKPLPAKYRFFHRGWIYRFVSDVLYYVIAVPVLWVYAKIRWGFRIVGKKKIKKLRLSGYFLYGNHTLDEDGFLASISFNLPKRTYVVASQETMSIFGIRWFLAMLGVIPVPKTPEEAAKFLEAVEYHYKKRGVIMIFPEAHIWPFCTRIRPFSDSNFTYPAQFGAPVVAMCMTYRQRKIFRHLPPLVTIHVSDPYYPDMGKTLGERTKLLRDLVYEFMEDTSASLDNYEYVHYVRKADGNDPAHR
ncbi:MAG: 1-acyl-sn-glycerol-3-phosphate acyltransferase [Bacilli bacterium]|jgi:1-acyl-sn-glycerol-3-phosphate acyltransferase|nr:1-acyl-sn-glycerol-3-phosphate acyltransferase [Bacilli bacterium]